MKNNNTNNHKEIKDLSKKEKVSLDNKSIFKGKDLKLVSELLIFLDCKNLSRSYKIRGGIEKQAEKGYFRNYRDIDLAIKAEQIKIFSEEYNFYVSAIQALTHASGGYLILNNWKVVDKTKEGERYVGLHVKYKFTISSLHKQSPSTTADLTFGTEDKGEKGFFETLLDL